MQPAIWATLVCGSVSKSGRNRPLVGDFDEQGAKKSKG